MNDSRLEKVDIVVTDRRFLVFRGGRPRAHSPRLNKKLSLAGCSRQAPHLRASCRSTLRSFRDPTGLFDTHSGIGGRFTKLRYAGRYLKNQPIFMQEFRCQSRDGL